MELSAGTHFVYILAASEATFLKSVNLEPEHFLVGMFKMGNVVKNDSLFQDKFDEGQKQEIIRDAAQLTELWKQYNLDPKQFRRYSAVTAARADVRCSPTPKRSVKKRAMRPSR